MSCTLPPPLEIPPPLAISPLRGGGDRHFTVLLGNIYFGGLCSPSVTDRFLHCFPTTSNQSPVFCDILSPKAVQGVQGVVSLFHRCFLPVTVYGTTHAHLVHMCWPLLSGLEIPLQSPPPPQGGYHHLATVARRSRATGRDFKGGARVRAVASVNACLGVSIGETKDRCTRPTLILDDCHEKEGLFDGEGCMCAHSNILPE